MVKKWLSDRIRNVLDNIIWVLIGIAYTSFSIPAITHLVDNVTKSLQPYKILIIIGVLSIGLAFLLWLYKKLNKYKPIYDKENPDFEILLKESILIFQNNKKIIFKKRMLLKALRDNLEEYHGQYVWTGDDDYTVESKIQGHIFEKINKTSVQQCYKITFDRCLKKYEDIEIEVDWILSDKNNIMSPLVGSVISEPTEELILEVRFPEGERENKKVFCEIFSHAGANHVIETKLIEVDRDGNSKWIINKPKLLHVYRLRWVD